MSDETEVRDVKRWGQVLHVTQEFKEHGPGWQDFIDGLNADATRKLEGDGYTVVRPARSVWEDAWTIRDEEGGVHWIDHSRAFMAGLDGVKPDMVMIRTMVDVADLR